MSNEAPLPPVEEIPCDECQKEINKAAIIGVVLGVGLGVVSFWAVRRAL